MKSTIPSHKRIRKPRHGFQPLEVVMFSLLLALVTLGSPDDPEREKDGNGPPNPEKRMLSNFEGNKAMQGWRSENGSDRDDIRLKLSTDRASEGEHSLALRYGEEGWRVARLDLAEHGTTDWRGWGELVFDLYVDGPEVPYLRVVLQSETGRVVRTVLRDIPSGRWLRCTLPLRRPSKNGPYVGEGFEETAPERMSHLRLLAHKNHPFERLTTIHVDNVRLLNHTPRDIKTLRDRAAALLKLETLSKTDRRGVRKLQTQAKRLMKRPTSTPRKRERRDHRLRELRKKMTPIARDTIAHRARADVAATAEALRETGLVQLPSDPLTPLKPAGASTGDTDLEQLALQRARQLSERAADRMITKRSIDRRFGDSDFAIGLPATPTALRDTPYAGEVGRSVTLRTAGRETEPFQFVVLPKGTALKNVRVEAKALEGPATIDADHIEVAPMGWHKRPNVPGWMADMLRPDIEAFDVAADRHQPVWVNVRVPPETPAGSYRGTITIRAENAETERIEVNLTVWPFTLPEHPKMGTATNCPPAEFGQPNHEAFARMITSHRWNPFQLYLWPEPQPLEWMRRQTEMGATTHNLLRISRHAASFEKGPNGKLRVTNKKLFFNRLDPIVKQIREQAPGFMDRVLVYGFDEPPPSQVQAMDDLYGDLKRRYPGLRTMFADLYGTWDKLPELPENVDVWASVASQLTPGAVERLQNAGMEVWWYNMYSKEDDPVGLRVQFWSTFKDGLDGMLFYALDAGGTGPRGRYEPWPMSLTPRTDRTDAGVLRRSKAGTPISTTAFEYWREGMEDLAYLETLRPLRDRLASRTEPGERTKTQRNLLHRADRLLDVPGYITAGLMDQRTDEVDEMVVETTGHTDDMAVILHARREIASLISQIKRELR